MRDYALKNEAVIFRVLESSSDNEQRAIAAHALGYARASRRQVAGLVRASLDPDELVRNNAVRALAVLVGARTEFVRQVPFSTDGSSTASLASYSPPPAATVRLSCRILGTLLAPPAMRLPPPVMF